MAIRPQDLTVYKNDSVADTVASTLYDLIATMPVSTARDASAKRMLLKHVQELVELHDSLDASEVLRTPTGNGRVEVFDGVTGDNAYAPSN